MGRVLAPPPASKGNDGDAMKARLVMEICSVSTTSSAPCAHRPQRRSPRSKPAFIDWYLLLRVDEDAGLDVIRKRYRQLALQLHPDKNKHPKAEVAFQLVSEAYDCLSDNFRRSAFNTERWSTSCPACRTNAAQQSQQPSINKDTHCPTVVEPHNAQTTANPFHPTRNPGPARPRRPAEALREARCRLEEEARIIDMCLRRSNSATARRLAETPVFDPAHYRVFSPGYPHSRRVSAPMPGHNYFGGLGCLRGCCSRRQEQSRCETPLYQIKTEGPTTRPGSSS